MCTFPPATRERHTSVVHIPVVTDFSPFVYIFINSLLTVAHPELENFIQEGRRRALLLHVACMCVMVVCSECSQFVLSF